MRAAPREYFIGGNVRNGLRHDERNSRYDMNRRRAHVATLSHHASRSEYCHCRYANSKTTGAHGDPPNSHYDTITVKLGQHQPFADIARKYGIFPKSSVGFGPPTHGRADDSAQTSMCLCTGPPEASCHRLCGCVRSDGRRHRAGGMRNNGDGRTCSGRPISA
jgi:hypothetical protein